MIEILRLSHRPFRDKRITTHCALTARAFDANAIYYSGFKDHDLEYRIKKTVDDFGGNFTISHTKNPVELIKEKKKSNYIIVHLTAYGLPINENISELRKKKILLIIGSEKVPPEIYKLADYNLSIGSQPHSEVAALSIFLHEYFKGKQLNREFSNSKTKIIPQKSGKLVKRQN